MLTILNPTLSQFGCLPLTTFSERCDGVNDEIKKVSKNYDDNGKKVNDCLKRVCDNLDNIYSSTFMTIDFTANMSRSTITFRKKY